MKNTKTVNLAWLFLGTLTVLLSLFFASPTRAAGSTNGFNAICNGTVSSGIACSGAFVDATVTAFSGSDFCATVNNALAALPSSSGGVVDARGLTTPATCAANLYTGITQPSIVLLPPGTITVSASWVMPNKSQLIGEGRDATTIKAASGFSGDVIDMGASGCNPHTQQIFGVVISDLTINLNHVSTATYGIADNCAAEGSEVNRVTISTVNTIGLLIGTNHSGPYSDLYILAGGSNTAACVMITGSSTRGIHGITCIGDGSPSAGIYLDGENDTIEDGHFEGVVDSILVGNSEPAADNLIYNITAADNGTANVTNIVHISNATTSGVANVSDLTLLQIGAYTIAGDTIKDDLTSTDLADPFVAIYVLGQPLGTISGGTGYSRFTTSTSNATGHAATWASGPGTPTGSCPTGSLFTNTTGGPKTTLYVCEASSWVPASF